MCIPLFLNPVPSETDLHTLKPIFSASPPVPKIQHAVPKAPL